MTSTKYKNWWRYAAISLCLVACVNLMSIPFRFGNLCFYNWSRFWWQSLLIFTATLALLSKHRINQALAAVAVLPVIYDCVVGIMAPWGYGPLAQAMAESGITPELWWEITRLHTADFADPILALMIVLYVIFRLSWHGRETKAQDLL